MLLIVLPDKGSGRCTGLPTGCPFERVYWPRFDLEPGRGASEPDQREAESSDDQCDDGECPHAVSYALSGQPTRRGDAMSDGETVVVVSEPAQPEVVVAEWVTRGELDAVVANLRGEFGRAVEDVAEVAVDALATAEDAEITAEVAGDRADIALEVAVTAEQTAETVVETAEEAEVAEETGGGPKAAEPRAEPAASPEKRKPTYGASSIYG
jgi:hypothetical protein